MAERLQEIAGEMIEQKGVISGHLQWPPRLCRHCTRYSPARHCAFAHPAENLCHVCRSRFDHQTILSACGRATVPGRPQCGIAIRADWRPRLKVATLARFAGSIPWLAVG